MDAGRGRGRGRRLRGGIKAAAEIRTAAALCALGLDGMHLLRTPDMTESLVMQAVANEAVKFLQARDRALAAEIAHAVSKLFR